MLGETAGAGTHQSKSKKGHSFLPFYFWTDLRYKEPPSVEVTKGGISTDINRSINWNLSTCYAFSYHINTSQHFSD